MVQAQTRGNGQASGRSDGPPPDGDQALAALTPKRTEADDPHAFVKAVAPRLKSILPKAINQQVFLSLLYEQIRGSDGLKEVAATNPDSLIGALLKLTQLGMRPGHLGEAWVLPFKNRRARRLEAQVIIGYRGWIRLAYQSGYVKSIKAHTVRERDEFEFDYGSDHLLHTYDPSEERGRGIAWYAVAHLTTGGRVFLVLGPSEIDRIRGKSPGAASDMSPWNSTEDFDAMAEKSCIRAIVTHWLPASEQMADATTLDGGIVRGLTSGSRGEQHADVVRVIDVQAVPNEGDGGDHDHETGEVPPEGRPAQAAPRPSRPRVAPGDPPPDDDAPHPVDDAQPSPDAFGDAVRRALGTCKIPELCAVIHAAVGRKPTSKDAAYDLLSEALEKSGWDLARWRAEVAKAKGGDAT